MVKQAPAKRDAIVDAIVSAAGRTPEAVDLLLGEQPTGCVPLPKISPKRMLRRFSIN